MMTSFSSCSRSRNELEMIGEVNLRGLDALRLFTLLVARVLVIDSIDHTEDGNPRHGSDFQFYR